MIRVDQEIVTALEKAGVNFACSVPCNLLAGVLERISKSKRVKHIPVTREEEGVGLCAGAYLAGARPVLLMQNSGLGNSINALLSLTKLYELGLLLLIGFRGRKGEEKIVAQIPMGEATASLLSIIDAKTFMVTGADEIGFIEEAADHAFRGRIGAVLLTPKVWEVVRND